MVKKDSESDDYYEGVKKFDCSFADFDAYMNDLDMEIESRFGPIGLGLWLGNAKRGEEDQAGHACSDGGEDEVLLRAPHKVQGLGGDEVRDDVDAEGAAQENRK